MSQGVTNIFLVYCLACSWSGFKTADSLYVERQWAELEFNFPSPEAEQIARAKNFYVPGFSVPIDVDVHYKNGSSPRIFVTIPRFGDGRPVTLGTVELRGRISAYPDYSWNDNQGQMCDRLTSVFRVAVSNNMPFPASICTYLDECSRLWVMDTGKIGETQACPPQLLAFNLQTDELIFRHVVNASNFIDTSLFITPVVDVRGRGPGDCGDTFVYVADVTGFGILVVDVAGNRSWHLTHRYFYPYPSKGSFTIVGESFDLMDGIFGMGLSPYRSRNADRFLYFHALASTTENVINTNVLRNDSHLGDPNIEPHLVNVFPEERPNQSAAEAIDRNGIMFFGLMGPPSIWCWNTATNFSQRNFHQIAISKETLQFASGVKVVNNLKGEQELWILTSSFQRVMTGTLTSNKTNFRILTDNISTLLADSPCKKLP